MHACKPESPELQTPRRTLGAVQASIDDWRKNNKVSRLWEHDASLWTNDDEAKWLGWLDIVDEQLGEIATLKNIAADIKKAEFKHALLLGMGGSSLCPEVLATDLRQDQAASPSCTCSIRPIPRRSRRFEAKLDLKSTLFIVSSKSGSTLEPNIYQAIFLRAGRKKRRRQRSRQSLHRHHRSRLEDAEAVAEGDQFRKIFFGVPSIGGRYSALSDFGMVPGRGHGHRHPQISRAARSEMVEALRRPMSPLDKNPGVVLGAILGTAAKSRPRQGHDHRVARHSRSRRMARTASSPNRPASIGKGIIPVDREALGAAGGLRQRSRVRLPAA